MTKWTTLKAATALTVLLSFSACITTTQLFKRGDRDPEPEATTKVKAKPAAPVANPVATPAQPSPPPPPSYANWSRISESPSTYFPKGMPKDSPTTHLSGEWVHSEDRSVRWFVPKGGFGKRSEQELQAEALSLRTQADTVQQASSQSSGTERGGFASRLALPFRKQGETNEAE